MKDKNPTKKEIEQNITIALDKIDSDGEQKVLDIIKKALENYSEDREFITEIFGLLVSRTREVKIKNNHLASELRQWSAKYQRVGYFLKWREEGILKWKEHRYSDEFLKYRKNIEEYFFGFDENDNMIFKYPNGVREELTPVLFDNLIKQLPEKEAESLYLKRYKEKTFWEILDEKGFDRRKEDTIEKIWNALFDLGGANIPTSKIASKTNISRRIVIERLEMFKSYGFVNRQKEKNKFLWSLEEPFIILKKSI